MDQAVSFTFLIRLIRKYWRSIILWAVGGIIVAGGLAFFVVTPQYKASVQVLVGQHSENAATQYAAQQADVQMITTYKELITNQVILKPAQTALKKQHGYTGTLGMLKNEVSVTSTQNSQVFSIDVLDSSPKRGAQIANQIAKTFKERVKKIIKVNNVTIVSAAVPASRAVSPHKLMYLTIGLVTGLLLGFFYASIRTLTDRRVHDSNFLTEELGLTSLGQVNHQHHHRHHEQIENIQTSQKSRLKRDHHH